LDREPFQEASDQLLQVLQWSPRDKEVNDTMEGLRAYQEEQELQVSQNDYPLHSH
jgi:hypothetical protein